MKITSSIIDIEKPVVSPYGLLGGAASVIKLSDNDQWLGGFTQEVFDAISETHNVRITGAETDTVSALLNGSTHLEYTPFAIRAKVKGSTFGSDPRYFGTKAEEILEIVQQKAVEQEFWSGAISKVLNVDSALGTDPNHRGNRWLASSIAQDVTPVAGGVKLRYGQALLEEALGNNTIGYRGTIHAPKAIASVMKIKDHKGILETNLGTSVVAGSGYSRQGPDGTIAEAGKYWIYGTGPVTVLLGESMIPAELLTQAINARNNSIEIYAEKPAAVVWSTEQVFAVLVDLNLDYS